MAANRAFAIWQYLGFVKDRLLAFQENCCMGINPVTERTDRDNFANVQHMRFRLLSVAELSCGLFRVVDNVAEFVP